MTLDQQNAAIWAAIDRIAEDLKASPSGLAIQAGMDATVFNVSKRKRRDGALRWPSTESIARVLHVAGLSFDDFARIMREVSA